MGFFQPLNDSSSNHFYSVKFRKAKQFFSSSKQGGRVRFVVAVPVDIIIVFDQNFWSMGPVELANIHGL